jgi:exopolysaccharide biosynthesis polyprenyl glycosylphosphotransferase
MVIVGTNPRAIEFAKKIESKPELGYRIIGFVDEEWEGIPEFQKNGYSLVSSVSLFADFIRGHVVDEVVITLPVNSFYPQIASIIGLCEEQGILVRYPSNMFSLTLGHSTTEHLEEDSLVTVYTGSMNGGALLVKRMVDFSLSLVLSILLCPLFLTIAILIKMTSTGPIFFIQSRPGLNKRPFKMIKFRTMVKDADKMLDEVAHLNEERGPAFKIKDDPRITRIGKFLRKTSVDELPQLINVFKGEMSLVGPRPFFYWEFDRIQDPWIKRRLSVRPGLTGLWQVNGRSNVTFDQRIRMDLEYIDNWSLAMDFRILAKTIPVVLFAHGAV